MAAFHVYVEGPVDRSPEGIQRLAVAISTKFGLPVPDLVKRMTAGRFRVKANIDAATADAYARSLEEVGARIKVEEAHPTQPAIPVVAAPVAAPPPEKPAAPPPPRSKPPTLPGEKPTRGGRYSVSPPRSKTPSAAPSPVPPPRSKAPSVPPTPTGPPPPREGHPSSQLMPVSRTDSAAPRAAAKERSGSSSLPPATERSGATSIPPATERSGSSSLPPANAARAGSSSLPPANAERAGSSSLPPANASRASNPAFQSGLSAAYSQEVPVAADLGALGSLSLASLDGDDASAAPVPFDLQQPTMPASIGPAPEPSIKFAPPTAKPAGPAAPAPAKAAVGFDMFAPPDAEEAEQKVELAPQEARPARSTTSPVRTTSPPLGVPSTPAMRKHAHSQGTVMGGVSAPEMPRARMAAGVLLAVILGFIPAHFIASMREGKAFKKIDAQIVATQTAADTPEMYAALDAFRAAQLDKKESERRSIALTSILLWAVVAAGVGYVWFRRIPWDRAPSA